MYILLANQLGLYKVIRVVTNSFLKTFDNLSKIVHSIKNSHSG